MSQEKSAVDGLKAKLYSREGQGPKRDIRAPLSPSEAEAPVAWAPSEEEAATHDRRGPLEEKPKMPFALKFFIGSVVFFLIALGVAAYMFFGGANLISPRNIELQLVAPSLVDGGKEATIQVIIRNRNTSDLLLADLVIDYPEGTRDPKNPTEDLSSQRISLGTLKSGSQTKQNISALFYGEEGSQQKVRAVVEYQVANSNAIFTKEGEVAFTLGSSPVSVSISAPQAVTSGEPFDMTVTVQSNASAPIENVVIQAQYPFGFALQSATPRSSNGNALWRLGTMLPGITHTITLRGSLDGQDGDERIFRFLAGSDSDETNTTIPVPFLTVPASLTVQRPLLAGTLTVDGQTGKNISSAAGKLLQGTVTWQNNLTESISDVEVSLTITGPMLDKQTVTPGTGFYQSGNSTIVWTKAQDPSLASISPGSKGDLQFSFATALPGSGGVVYTNPTVTLSLQVKGVRQGAQTGQQVTSSASSAITLASAVALSAQSTYLSGARPPRVETPSVYSVLWSVRNSSNTLANGIVSTVLPPYASFVASQSGSGVSYDAASRTVRWAIGDVKAGVGYSEGARTAAFQISITPSATQISSAPALTGSAVFTAQDRFAQVQVTATAAAPTTIENVVPAQ